MSVKHFFPDTQAVRRFLPCLLGLVLVASAYGTESGAAADTPAGDAVANGIEPYEYLKFLIVISPLRTRLKPMKL